MCDPYKIACLIADNGYKTDTGLFYFNVKMHVGGNKENIAVVPVWEYANEKLYDNESKCSTKTIAHLGTSVYVHLQHALQSCALLVVKDYAPLCMQNLRLLNSNTAFACRECWAYSDVGSELYCAYLKRILRGVPPRVRLWYGGGCLSAERLIGVHMLCKQDKFRRILVTTDCKDALNGLERWLQARGENLAKNFTLVYEEAMYDEKYVARFPKVKFVIGTKAANDFFTWWTPGDSGLRILTEAQRAYCAGWAAVF